MGDKNQRGRFQKFFISPWFIKFYDSGFYNDICYTYTSDKGKDISLDDRRKEFIDKNLAVCEENCDIPN